MQAVYRLFHFIKSALLRVQNDILSLLNNKQMVSLVLLDLSAAFDTINHKKNIAILDFAYMAQH